MTGIELDGTVDGLAGGSGGVSPDADAGESVRAAIYARTSSLNQQRGYSLAEQVHRCRQRCEQRGWTVAFMYRDEAESGKDTDRPMFSELQKTAAGDGFDVVVVWKLDRLSRSLLHAVQLEQEFREQGVALHSVTEQIDTTTPAGRFNFRSIASAAEFERELIKQRSQMGFRALARELKWPNGRPPLGYRKTNEDRLVIDEEEAAFVRQIFVMYREERSMPQVAHDLNEAGRTTKDGGEWTARAVGDVLRNELYTGLYTVADVSQQVEEYQIIDQELFETVTEIRHRFRRDEPSEQSEIPADRKSNVVDGMVETYLEYVQDP